MQLCGASAHEIPCRAHTTHIIPQGRDRVIDAAVAGYLRGELSRVTIFELEDSDGSQDRNLSYCLRRNADDSVCLPLSSTLTCLDAKTEKTSQGKGGERVESDLAGSNMRCDQLESAGGGGPDGATEAGRV